MAGLDTLEIASYILKRCYHKNITLDRVGGVDEAGKEIDRWAIRDGDHICMGKDGEWIIEELPSNRDKEYYDMYRWSDPDEALQFWLGLKKTIF